MAEHPKLQTYRTMAVQGTAAITGSFDTWAAFLRTVSRLYKYSFWEQLLIHVQRPDATACAEYAVWTKRMGRYVRRGAKGIAIISQVDGAPALRYVFDIADTGLKQDARTPWLWQYREEHQATVSKMLEECFSVPADKGVPFQLAAVAAQFAQKYWETYREKILGAVRNTLLQKYGGADAGMAFQDAVAASVSYTLLYRCGLAPEQFFDAGDFFHVYECRDHESVLALGTAVSEIGAMLLRVLEHTIKRYEREKRAKQQQERIGAESPPPAADPGGRPAPEEPPQQPDTASQGGPDETSSDPSSVSAPGQQEITLPVPAPTAPVSTPQPKPQSVPAGNFRITDDRLGEGGPRAKYAMNVEAIRTLQAIEADGRNATPDEQEILSRYMGWGGVPEAFDPDKAKWADEYRELKALLTDEEYTSARASTLNAHFTTPVVIRAIYEALGNMGFVSGNILEPSCGVGNFFGCLPEGMSASRLYGVELDGISGRIAQQLYPKANIAVRDYEKADFPRDFFDLAVGNVPFGDYKVNDPAYDKLGFTIHNYFFAKALDQLRPGGILSFITSRYTMDSKDSTVRKYLSQRADLLGAIRLPNDAFRANAGTNVVADIIFLQKREEPAVELPDWVGTMENPDGYPVNCYFNDHPEMVLGRPGSESTRYGHDYTVYPAPGADLARQLHEAAACVHGTYRVAEAAELEAEEADGEAIPADPGVKNFSYTVVDGTVYYRENSVMVKSKLNATATARVKGLIGLRECVRQLIDLQLDGVDASSISLAPPQAAELTHSAASPFPTKSDDFAGAPDLDSIIRSKQAELNRLYDAYVRKYGLINGRGSRLAFDKDSSYYLLCSLEVLDDDGNMERKADIFTKRTIKQHRSVTHVDTASEALVVSIGERARVDLPFMAQLTGKPEAELVADLRGVIYQDPKAADGPLFGWQTADEYLSGNVRRKLRVARQAAERDPAFQANVTALEAVQPKDLEASEIEVRVGATWIDKSYYQQFMYETFNTTANLRRSVQVQYSPHTAEWFITGKGGVPSNDVAAYTTYGTKRASAYDILEDSLNLRDVRIYDTVTDPDGKERRVINGRETTLAVQKQQAVRDAFQTWLWKDPERRQALVRLYNDTMNCIRPREYDGSHIVFSGINPGIKLQPHQVNAIARVLYGGNTLLAHEVGAGKTFEMIASAMEAKRLGLCSKSIFVVPNHLTQQTAAEFLRLYPAADILVTTKRDFQTARRKKFCARIATGGYDAVIIGHSQFEKIPVSAERQEKIIRDQIWEITEGIREVKASGGERFTVKQLERTKKELESDLEKVQGNHRKDSVVTFEQLGVDMMFVDESDLYKNLFLYTKMRNVAGLSTAHAQKSSDMFAKCRYLDEITGNRGIVFATGTPMSNSMSELYSIQRYLQHDRLQEMGMGHFDCWASRFGETVTALELAPEGTGYRARTRFSRFFNLPELMAMFREVADIKTADQLNLPVPEAGYHTVVSQPTAHQQAMVKELSKRAAKVHSGSVDVHIDNMLKITSDGRKLGLDQRIINPALPDEPGTKVNKCVANVLRHWRDGEADKLTQLIFCDISTPTSAKGGFNIYDDIRQKLIAGGMARSQIAFIHEANTDEQKKALFAKVRSGQVRVLIGSTAKCGAGTNIQDRLIALHDLDCPWRPRDLTQRAGRIVRRDNMNETVHIYRYVTESTFDAYLWQTIENKQKFISQIMTSKSPVRSCDDVDEQALSYAEIKALCAGDPRIKERMELDTDVARLKIMRADHQNQQFRMEDNLLKHFPQQIADTEKNIAAMRADMEVLARHPHPVDGFAGMTVNGTAYSSRIEAGTALLDACADVTENIYTEIGGYRGFVVFAAFNGVAHVLTLKSAGSCRVEVGPDPRGNTVRMDNALAEIPERLEYQQAQLANLRQQMEAARAEIGKPFPREEEYQRKSARLVELDAQLNIGGKTSDGQTV